MPANDLAPATAPPPPADDAWHLGRSALALLAALPLAAAVTGLCHVSARWLNDERYDQVAFVAGAVAWVAWTTGITLYRSGRTRYQTLRDVWALTTVSATALMVLALSVAADVEAKESAALLPGFDLFLIFVASFASLLWCALLGVATLASRRDLKAPVEEPGTLEPPKAAAGGAYAAAIVVAAGLAAFAGWNDAYAQVAPWTVAALALVAPGAFAAIGLMRRDDERAPRRLVAVGVALVSSAALPVALVAMFTNHASITESVRRGDEIVRELVAYRSDHYRYPKTLDALEEHVGKPLPRPTTAPEFLFRSGWRRFLLGFEHEALGPGSVYDSELGRWQTGNPQRM